MNPLQVTSLPLLLTVFAVLGVASALLSGASQRAGVRVVLGFLALEVGLHRAAQMLRKLWQALL